MPGTQSVRRRTRPRRVLFALALAGVILLFAAVALAPTVASRFVPALVADAGTGAINGTVVCRGASLSWFGSQRLGPIIVTDTSGEEAARVSIEARRGLAGLVLGSRDLGVVLVTGTARVVRYPDGTTNIERLVPPSPGAPGSGDASTPPAPSPTPAQPLRLPSGLAGEIVLDGLTIEYARSPAEGASPPAPTLRAIVDSGRVTLLDGALSAGTVTRIERAGAAEPPARIEGDADLNGLIGPDGIVRAGDARLEATLSLADLPLSMLEELFPLEPPTGADLTGTLDASLDVRGGLKDGTAAITASSPALQADAEIAWDESSVRASAPGRIALAGEHLRSLLETLSSSPDGAQVTVARAPDVTIDLRSFRMPRRLDPASLTLDSLALEARALIGAARGEVALQGEDPVAWTLSPIEIVCATDPGAGEIRLVAGAPEGVSGGGSSLTGDVILSGLGSGGSDRPRLEGSFALARLPTALAQPFVAASNLDLPTDLGPWLDASFRVRASLQDPESDRFSLASLEGEADIQLKSEFLDGEAALAAADARLRQTGPITLILLQGERLATRLARSSGVTVTGASPLELRVEGMEADLERLLPSAPARAQNDPTSDAIRGRAILSVADFRGTLAHERPELSGEWALGDLSATLDATRGSDEIRLDLASTGRWSGESLGRTELTLIARGLLAADGTLREEPESIELTGAIEGASPGAGRAFAQGLGIDPSEVIGPRATLRVEGVIRPTLAPEFALRDTTLTLDIESEGVTGKVPLTADSRGARAHAGGIDLTLRRPGRLLAGLLPPEVPLHPLPGGIVRVRSGDLGLPFEADSFSPDFAGMTGEVAISASGLSGETAPLAGGGGGREARRERFALTQAEATLGLGPELRLRLDSTLSGPGGAFSLLADLASPGAIEHLLSGESGGPLPIRPLGRIEVKDLPIALADLLTLQTPHGSEPLGGLLAGILGERTSASLETSSAGEDLAFALESASGGSSLQARGRLGAEAVRVEALSGELRATPEAINRLVRAYADDPSALPSASGVTILAFSGEPFTLPLREDAFPAWERADALSIRARGATRLGLQALLAEVAADARQAMPSELVTDDLELSASVPLSVLAPEGAASAPGSVGLTGSLSDGAGAALGRVEVSASGSIASAGAVGALSARVRLSGFRTSLADALLGEAGIVSGAIGSQADFEASTELELASANDAEPLTSLDLRVSASGPRLTLPEPVRVMARPDRVALASPLRASITPTPEWAARYLLGADPKAPGVGFASPPRLEADLSTLTIARGEGVGPLKPGVFRLVGEVRSPLFELTLADGSVERLEGLHLRVDSNPQNSQFVYRAMVDRVGGMAAPDGGAAVRAEGALGNLTDRTGAVHTENARFNTDLSAPALPTALVDGLAQQNGLMLHALGTPVSVEARARRLSRSEGTIDVTATSPRATMRLVGEVVDGVLALTPETQATLRLVTPEFGTVLVKGLPLVGTFQKSAEEAPGTLRTTGLRLPLDGDLKKVSGEVALDPGEVQFKASQSFGEILRIVKQREETFIGRRLEPLHLKIAEGVISYDQYKLSVGELTVETEGRAIDLVNRRLDVVTWIPLGALTDSAAGQFNTGLGSAIGRAVPMLDEVTLVPWRTTGPLDNPRTTPAPGLFVERFGNTLLRPDRLIRGIFGGRDRDDDKDDDDGGG